MPTGAVAVVRTSSLIFNYHILNSTRDETRELADSEDLEKVSTDIHVDPHLYLHCMRSMFSI